MRRVSTRYVAWILIASGGISVAMAAVLGWWIVSGTDPMGTNAVRVVGWVMALATYVLMVVGGIQLLRRSRLVPWLLPSVFAVQLPILEIGPVSYAIIPFPKVAWGLWPEFGLTASLGERIAVTLDGGDRPFSVGFNLVALALLFWIDKHVERTAPGTEQPAG